MAKKHSPLLEAFGASVRRVRVAQEMTQERLAELADLNPRTIQKIESGSLDILLTTVCRLQAALGCRWDQIMHGEVRKS